MKPSKRREIRDRLRQATERAHAPEPPPPLVPEIVIHEVVCLCGQFLRLNSGMNGKRCSCPACRRKFLVTFVEDDRTKGKVLAPVYLDDSLVTGNTIFAESMPEPPEDAAETKGEFDDLLEPSRPDQICFVCPCGRKLMAKPASYDRRVKCPHCRQRMLLTVVYDPEDKVFKIQPVRVEGEPAGDTKPADEPEP